MVFTVAITYILLWPIFRLLLHSIACQTQSAMEHSTHRSNTIGFYSEHRHHKLINCMIAIAESLDPPPLVVHDQSSWIHRIVSVWSKTRCFHIEHGHNHIHNGTHAINVANPYVFSRIYERLVSRKDVDTSWNFSQQGELTAPRSLYICIYISELSGYQSCKYSVTLDFKCTFRKLNDRRDSLHLNKAFPTSLEPQ
jgi:hypothetical protein